MDEMRAEYEAMKLVPKTTLKEMVTNPSLRAPLTIAVMMMLAQQLSGINAVTLFIHSHFSKKKLEVDLYFFVFNGFSLGHVLLDGHFHIGRIDSGDVPIRHSGNGRHERADDCRLFGHYWESRTQNAATDRSGWHDGRHHPPNYLFGTEGRTLFNKISNSELCRKDK